MFRGFLLLSFTMQIFHISFLNVFWQVWSMRSLGSKAEYIFKILLESFSFVHRASWYQDLFWLFPWWCKTEPLFLSHLYKKSRFLDKAGKRGSVGAWALSWGIPLWSEWLSWAATCLRGAGEVLLLTALPLNQTDRPSGFGRKGRTQRATGTRASRWSRLLHRRLWSHSSPGQHVFPKPRWVWDHQPGWLSQSPFLTGLRIGYLLLSPPPPSRGLPLSPLLWQVPLP